MKKAGPSSKSRSPHPPFPTVKPRATVLVGLAVLLVIATHFYILSFHFLSQDLNDENQQAASAVQPPRKAIKTALQRTTNKTPKATIGYAVSLTGCGFDLASEGAAVLKHSIHLSSIQVNNSTSLYDYKMYAIVHPSAMACSDPFVKLGYEVVVRDTPIKVEDIRGEFLRTHVEKTGCCGEKEYIKLYAYTLIDHPIVVHLDLDSLILQPLDDLFDIMLGDRSESAQQRVSKMWQEPLPERVDAFFTRDYNMVNPNHKHVGVQGGFLVVRPSLKAFQEYVDIILEGDFEGGSGWGGKYGGYYGAQQIQGICSYFWDHKHPGTAVELNRCIYNQMADAPRYSEPNKKGEHLCTTGQDECEDCQKTNVSLVKSVHFTLCQKPWWCPIGSFKSILCRDFHEKWFRVRMDLEDSLGLVSDRSGELMPETFLGYCHGRRRYIPIKFDF